MLDVNTKEHQGYDFAVPKLHHHMTALLRADRRSLLSQNR